MFYLKVCTHTNASVCTGFEYTSVVIIMPIGDVGAVEAYAYVREFHIYTTVQQQYRNVWITGCAVDIDVGALPILPTQCPVGTHASFGPYIDPVINVQYYFMPQVVQVVTHRLGYVQREMGVSIADGYIP